MREGAAGSHRYLLTGVTGFLGKVVLEELVRRRGELRVERVYVLVRPKGRHGGAARFAREVAPSPCLAGLPPGWRDLVEVVDGSLDAPDLALSPETRAELTARVTHVVHAAASVEFDLRLEAAVRANVTTSLHLLELARACERLRALVYVSTAYTTPHPGDGVAIEEALAPLPGPAEALYRAARDEDADGRALLARSGHPNTYTLTKSLAEHLLVARRGAVPLAIVRPSIISAARRHPFPGWIDSTSGFAGFVIFLGLGHLRAVIGEAGARLDLVPVDDVAARILEAGEAVAGGAPEPLIRHAVAGVERSPTVRDCWEMIHRFFRVHRVDRRPTLRYLGPPGFRFTLAEALHHRLAVAAARVFSRRARRAGRQLLARLDHLNTAFPYFTGRTFAFRTRGGIDAPFDPRAYVTVVCRGVYRHLLGRDDRQWVLAGRDHAGHGGDLLWALRQPRGNVMIRFAGWLITKVLRRIGDRVTVDLPSFEAARRGSPPGSPLVIVPSHRSYLDFVLCSYLFFARPDLGIPIPHVAAATEFGRIPILGRLLHAVHAFYLARGVRRENKELAQRVQTMIRSGWTLEFFIEGTRSRSREFLSPKRGLLRCLQATGRTCTLLPVAISYDRVPEEAVFARELAGMPKPRMRLRGLLRWGLEAFRGRVSLGHIHIACGAPVRLQPEGDTQAAARAVISEIQRASVATTYHLRAFLAHHPVEGVDPGWLARAIEGRGGRVLDSDLVPDPGLDPLIAGTLRHQFAHHFQAETPPDEPTRRLQEALYGRAGGEESVA